MQGETIFIILQASFGGVALFIYLIINLSHYESSKYEAKKTVSKVFPKNKLKLPQIESVLQNTTPYFLQLDKDKQRIFIKRVQNFLESKNFRSKGGVQITDEMKVQVAASAVMISFGLERYRLSRFHTIYILSDSYYLENHDTYAQGHVSKKGSIYISWKHFIEGFAKDDDKYNLGIHEMAHAVDFSKIIFYKRNTYLLDKARRYKSDLEELYKDSRSKKFLPEYSRKNLNEFFAVATECFFENAKDMRREAPSLYRFMVKYLNQDPAAMRPVKGFEYKSAIVETNEIISHEKEKSISEPIKKPLDVIEIISEQTINVRRLGFIVLGILFVVFLNAFPMIMVSFLTVIGILFIIDYSFSKRITVLHDKYMVANNIELPYEQIISFEFVIDAANKAKIIYRDNNGKKRTLKIPMMVNKYKRKKIARFLINRNVYVTNSIYGN